MLAKIAGLVDSKGAVSYLDFVAVGYHYILLAETGEIQFDCLAVSRSCLDCEVIDRVIIP